MKMVKEKQILMAADFAGYPLKEAIKEYLAKKGWTVTDIGVKADSDPNGFKVKHLGDCHCELYDRPEGFPSVPLMCKRQGA